MAQEGNDELLSQMQQLRCENELLRSRLAQATASGSGDTHETVQLTNQTRCQWEAGAHGLNSAEISRYSRQLLLPSFGIEAQAQLLRGSVLIIGAGGLGSPAALYLTAAGAGRIGIVDQDVVEVNNLHRQIIHSEARVGMHKAESAAFACQQLNAANKVEVHKAAFTPQNALHLVSQYDVVLDCTDNAPSRYLISDACVVAGKPLVSGAAIGTDGQLTVYNYGDDGPCYRCLFPIAPLPESCSRCSDAGVLGVIPGIIGSLQALEAIKIMAGVGQVASRKLVIFDGLAMRFHTVKLRARMKECIACGSDASITAESLPTYSYTDFTGQPASDSAPPQLHLLPESQRISPQELVQRLQDGEPPLVIDVRPHREFELAHLAGSVNYPFDESLIHLPHMVKQCKQHTSSSQVDSSALHQQSDVDQEAALARGELQHTVNTAKSDVLDADSASHEIVVVCRRGNDSQHIVQSLREHGIKSAVDLTGGLSAWSQQADKSFPDY